MRPSFSSCPLYTQVILSIKKNDGDGFLYETTTASTNDDLISELCEIWNARLRVRILAPGLRELGKYGPMKKVVSALPDKQCQCPSCHDIYVFCVLFCSPPLSFPPSFFVPLISQEEQGLDEVNEKYEGAELMKNEYYQADPSGLRTGNGPGPELAATLERVATDAETYCDKSQVQKRINLSLSEINDKIANMRGAVMMSYPMGLPEWDTIKLAMDSVDGLEGTGVAAEIMQAESAQLWCAGKEFIRGQLVSDRLGKNEKVSFFLCLCVFEPMR